MQGFRSIMATLALAVSAPALAQGESVDQIIARAKALATQGKNIDARALLEAAEPQAAAKGHDTHWQLLDQLNDVLSAYDIAAMTRHTARMIAFADRHFGRDDFRTARIRTIQALFAGLTGDATRMLRDMPDGLAEMRRLARSPAEREETGTASMLLAKRYVFMGREDDARVLVSRTMAVMDAGTPVNVNGATTYETAADMQTGWGDYAQALIYGRRAVALYERFEGPNTVQLSVSLGIVARLLVLTGRADEAEPLLIRALRIADGNEQRQPAILVRTLLEYAAFQRDRGRTDLALPLYARSLVVAEGLAPGSDLAEDALTDIARVYLSIGDIAAARRANAGAIERAETAKRRSAALAMAYLRAAQIELAAGDTAAARTAANKGAALFGDIAKPDDPRHGDARAVLAQIAAREGDTGTAATLWQESVALMVPRGWPNASRETATISAARAATMAGRQADWAAARRAGDAMTTRLIRRAAALPTTGTPDGEEARMYGALLDVAWGNRMMTLRMMAALAISLVTATPAVADVDPRVAPQVARLMAEADASKARKDDPGALAAAKAALAAADARKGDERSQYEALDHLTGFWPSGDLEGSFVLFDRLAPLAARVEGSDAYRTHAALSGRNLLAFFLGKPGASLDAIAPPLERAIATARTDKERMDTGAIGLVLGQFYTNAGQRPKAEAIIERSARLFETPPATPVSTFPGGLTTLAQIHAAWGDWSRSLSYADRAIVAHDEVDRRRTVNAAAPLIHRGNALNAMQRFEDAEIAHRTAVALTDTAPDPFIKASALSAIGRFYVSTGRDALAVPLLTRAADLATSFPPGAGSRMAALSDLYGIAMRRTDFAEALRLMQLAQDDVEKRTFRNSLSHGVVLLSLASAALPLGKLDEARKAIEAAAPMVEKGDRPGGQRQADLRIVRGRLALREGRIDAGVAELQSGIAMFSALPNTDPNAAAAAEATLADALLQQPAPGAAWASGRRGAQRITDAIIRRSMSAGAGSVLSGQEMNVLDTALKAAWMAQHHAMPVTATPPPAKTARTL